MRPTCEFPISANDPARRRVRRQGLAQECIAGLVRCVGSRLFVSLAVGWRTGCLVPVQTPWAGQRELAASLNWLHLLLTSEGSELQLTALLGNWCVCRGEQTERRHEEQGKEREQTLSFKVKAATGWVAGLTGWKRAFAVLSLPSERFHPRRGGGPSKPSTRACASRPRRPAARGRTHQASG